MAAEPYAAQGALFSQIEKAVEIGFGESGLAKLAEAEGGSALSTGLQGYTVVLLGGFTHRGAMFERYQTERGKFAALVGDEYFNAVLQRIQEGDIALFHGLFLSGIYLIDETEKAGVAYRDVAALLRGDRQEHRFFDFLHAHAHEVMEGVGATAEHLNIPRQRSTQLYTPAIERQFGRN